MMRFLCALGFHRRAYRCDYRLSLTWGCVRCGEIQAGPLAVKR